MRRTLTFHAGWTPPADSPAYEAFLRSAQTFEDAQNIQFLEAELEDKLRSEGLPPQEQQTLQDIQTIKSFLDIWPTQLTDFGLQTISESLAPGQFAILFRNDHFSTIYKEPTHGALMTLVTDAGYSTHDEIVWESLVDVTGAASEMFSGDFRVVSHNQDVRLNQGNSGGGKDGWQTVQNRNQRKSSGGLPSPNPSNVAPPLPGPRPTKAQEAVQAVDSPLEIPDPEAARKASEQEDHDLALALQLQEEEEAQQREVQERQRREQELSEQFLSNEGEGPRPPIPPRRNAGRGGSGPTTSTNSSAPTARPAVNRPTDDPTDPEAPPSYEQAASDRPYRPGAAPNNPEQGNPLSAYDALRRQQASNSTASPAYSPQQGRRQSNARILRRQSQMGGPSVPGAYVQSGQNPQRVGQAANVKDADDKCIVM
jgi:ubiquitin carboxyl-terminal hydrolase MINDY-1/2